MAVSKEDAYWIAFQYSEWLDSQNLIVSEEETGDHRTFDELAHEFLAERSDQASPVIG